MPYPITPGPLTTEIATALAPKVPSQVTDNLSAIPVGMTSPTSR